MRLLIRVLAIVSSFSLCSMGKSEVAPVFDISGWSPITYTFAERDSLLELIEAQDFVVVSNGKQLRFKDVWEHEFLKQLHAVSKKSSHVSKVEWLGQGALFVSGRDFALQLFDIKPREENSIWGIAIGISVSSERLSLKSITGTQITPRYDTLEKDGADELLKKIAAAVDTTAQKSAALSLIFDTRVQQNSQYGFARFWSRPFVRNLSISAALCAGLFCIFKAKPTWFSPLLRLPSVLKR